MNIEKVVFAFVILLAATLNFGFVYGDIDDPAHHDIWELFAAVVVNLVATVLKLGDRTQIGAVHLSTSLVAVLQLIAATLVWFFAVDRGGQGIQPAQMAAIVSLAAGALFANVVSVALMVTETVMLRR
jgi:hypothetical protein